MLQTTARRRWLIRGRKNIGFGWCRTCAAAAASSSSTAAKRLQHDRTAATLALVQSRSFYAARMSYPNRPKNEESSATGDRWNMIRAQHHRSVSTAGRLGRQRSDDIIHDKQLRDVVHHRNGHIDDNDDGNAFKDEDGCHVVEEAVRLSPVQHGAIADDDNVVGEETDELLHDNMDPEPAVVDVIINHLSEGKLRVLANQLERYASSSMQTVDKTLNRMNGSLLRDQASWFLPLVINHINPATAKSIPTEDEPSLSSLPSSSSPDGKDATDIRRAAMEYVYHLNRRYAAKHGLDKCIMTAKKVMPILRIGRKAKVEGVTDWVPSEGFYEQRDEQGKSVLEPTAAELRQADEIVDVICRTIPHGKLIRLMKEMKLLSNQPWQRKKIYTPITVRRVLKLHSYAAVIALSNFWELPISEELAATIREDHLALLTLRRRLRLHLRHSRHKTLIGDRQLSAPFSLEELTYMRMEQMEGGGGGGGGASAEEHLGDEGNDGGSGGARPVVSGQDELSEAKEDALDLLSQCLALPVTQLGVRRKWDVYVVTADIVQIATLPFTHKDEPKALVEGDDDEDPSPVLPPGLDGLEDLNSETTVFIANLPPDVTESTIVQAFHRCGDVSKVKLYYAREASSPTSSRLSSSSLLSVDVDGEAVVDLDITSSSAAEKPVKRGRKSGKRRNEVCTDHESDVEEEEGLGEVLLGSDDVSHEQELLEKEKEEMRLRKKDRPGGTNRTRLKTLEQLHDSFAHSPIEDAYAFVTFKDISGFDKTTSESIRIFGMHIGNRNCRTSPAREKSTLFVTNHTAKTAAQLEEELCAILASFFNVSLRHHRDKTSSPEKVRLDFGTYEAARVAEALLVHADQKVSWVIQHHKLRSNRRALAEDVDKLHFLTEHEGGMGYKRE